MSDAGTGGTGAATDYKRLWNIYKTLGVNPMSLSYYERDVLSNIVMSQDIDESFEDIGGNEQVKDNIDRLVIKPTLNPSIYKGKRLLRPPNGIILYGPPGTGKTMTARAVAKKIGGYFINVTSNLIENKYYGESQKIVHAIFSIADKIKPCVVFFDEIDGLCGTRNIFDQSHVTSVKTTLLGEIDGIHKRDPGVIVFGATNRIDNLDPALKRRMRLHIKVDLPSQEARKQIIQKILDDEPIDGEVDIDQIAKDTEGMSGSDLHELCKLAAQHAMCGAAACDDHATEDVSINKANFDDAIDDIV
jgi:SpoVK/Ycf46/Vps4 family AAA+-type ATPase|tara:strand:- start:7341 stop:8249 length:909 start_codon:yes stop_codon:yes gene_type:complete